MWLILILVCLFMLQLSGLAYLQHEQPHLYSEYPTSRHMRGLSLEVGDEDPSLPYGNRTYKHVAFYHVYAEGSNYNSIVHEQVNFLKNTKLLDVLDTVLYSTVGNGNYSIESFDFLTEAEKKKFIHYKHFGRQGNEENTIKKLYSFCHHHPRTKVLYFHDKGSFHNTKGNEEFRHNLNCYTLTPACIEALDTFDTCGMRASPMPFIHYSGNFWWARCSYISKLIDPMSFYTNKTFASLTKTINPCVNGGERYFAEAWVGSHPDIKPADCLSADTDNTYFYGYNFPPTIHKHCPNPNQTWGWKCGNASILVSPQKFVQGYNRMRDISGELCQQDIPGEVTKRSYIWYGQPANTYTPWINQLIKLPNLRERMPYKVSYDRQVYWYRNGSMHAIPSLKILVRLAFEITDIITIPGYQMNLIPKGSDLPDNMKNFY